jgi:hypothetical protein
MPKFNETLTAEAYFEIDGNQYQKGNYDAVYIGDRVGVSNTSNNVEVVKPVAFSSWTNNSDVAYASLQDLKDDFKTSFFF